MFASKYLYLFDTRNSLRPESSLERRKRFQHARKKIHALILNAFGRCEPERLRGVYAPPPPTPRRVPPQRAPRGAGNRKLRGGEKGQGTDLSGSRRAPYGFPTESWQPPDGPLTKRKSAREESLDLEEIRGTERSFYGGPHLSASVCRVVDLRKSCFTKPCFVCG